jgi:cytoskeletal protein CcmA (bactofilin family)
MAENAQTHSFITSDVEVIGTIKSSSAIRLDGKLEGELHCESDVAIGKTAVIKGNLEVNSITVAGTINGNITARDKIELKSTAKLLGDIKAKRLSVEDGVTFVGRSEVNPTGAETPKPQQAPAADQKPKQGEPPKGDNK